jgi:hypothetical protein
MEFEPERAPRPAYLTPTEEYAVANAAHEVAETGRLNLSAISSFNQVHMTDIQDAGRQFMAQAQVLSARGHGFPMVELAEGPPVPVDLLNSFTQPAWLGRVPDLRHLPEEEIDRILQTAPNALTRTGLRFAEATIEEAKQSFGYKLRDYLMTRVVSARGLFSSQTGGIPTGTHAVPGLTLRVNSNDSNLQILYSPAFFIDIQMVFGNHLSTPVDGHITPGIYIFGARGRALPTTFEPVQYSGWSLLREREVSSARSSKRQG